MPFLHCDAADGKIAFQGHPVGNPSLAQPGDVAVTLRFVVPPEAKGKSYRLATGLFRPALLGQPNERLRPDSDEGDRRVLLGEITVDDQGVPTLAAP
ncbi:MAG: hypothetical protein HZB16_22625 [Armatimonadetes bacterium]|nr:hypothetical protein [Armatimonadota bacterium]